MGRLIRNTAVLLKAESTYAVDPTPTGGANAMLVSNLSINPLNAQNVDRALIRPFLGGSEMLIGPSTVECSFDVEFVGSGTVATAPSWAAPLLACGFAQTLTATIRADYTPVSSSLGSCTIYWYDDGVLHKILGAMGKVTGMVMMGGLPKLSFSFIGLDGGATAVSNPSVTLSGFLQPQVVYDATTSDLTLGATHSTTLAPSFSGGTVYSSTGVEFDIGNEVVFNAFLGGEAVDIVQRTVSGKIEIPATAAQEVALITACKAGTLQSLGLLHGTVANRKVGIWCPTVQLMNPGKGDRNGVRTFTADFRALPSTTGNDEIRLIASYA
jgi:hypothetical protein